MPFWLEIVINVAFSYIASVGFALTINVHIVRLIHLELVEQ